MIGQRELKRSVQEAERSSLKLSSGTRIYYAADDPAGLAISERMRAKSAGLSQAKRNANDTVSLLQIAEGTLNTVQELGSRLKELAMQAANDTLTDAERAIANREFQSLKTEIKRMQESASYNGNKIMQQGNFTMQIGVNSSNSDRLSFNMQQALRGLSQLGIDTTNIATKRSSQITLGRIDEMLQKVSESRAVLGSLGNRLESTVNNLMISKESTESSKTQIRDTDFAAEMSNKVSAEIRRDATTALLTNANNLPNRIMKLLE